MSRVLCVDDEKSVLSSLRRLFIDEPWEVFTADCGEEGLNLIDQYPMDLVLSDFRMPGMDGVQFLKQVRQRHPDCMRIVLSGFADVALTISALNEGQIYKFIAKPWNGAELVDTIRKLLEHQRIDREYRTLGAELRMLNRELSERIETLEREAQSAAGYARLLHEALEHSPVPVIGIASDGAVFLASRGARDILTDDGKLPPDIEGVPEKPTLPAVIEASVGEQKVLLVLADGTPPPPPEPPVAED